MTATIRSTPSDHDRQLRASWDLHNFQCQADRISGDLVALTVQLNQLNGTAEAFTQGCPGTRIELLAKSKASDALRAVTNAQHDLKLLEGRIASAKAELERLAY